MKKLILFFLFLIALLPLSVFSQSEQEDVIYMKNGSVYRGTIIEQIPNVSYKIEIAGGSVIFIKAEDVVKITKEDKKSTDGYVVHSYSEDRLMRPKPVYEYKFRPKGYFLQIQAEAEALQFGFRVVNGYKFGQFAYLGLGLGVDGLIMDIHGSQDYGGGYIPIYVYYAGDILKTHITPFYSLEAGYAFRPDPLSIDDYGVGGGSGRVGGHGGFMGGAGFGVRFYSRRRVHFDISAHIDFKMATENYVGQAYTPGGYTISYYYSTNELVIIPGVR
jgi:hypothetical protein